MKCKRCGSTVDGHFCRTCGAPVENPKSEKPKSKKPNGCLVAAVTFFASVFVIGGIGSIMRAANVPEAFPSSQSQQTEMQEEKKKETESKQKEQPKEEDRQIEQLSAESEEEKQQPIEEQPTEPTAAEEQSKSKTPDFGDGNNIEVKEGYVLNTSTLKFHLPHCRHVKKIEEENFATCDSREWAISNGYQPCKVCNP